MTTEKDDSQDDIEIDSDESDGSTTSRLRAKLKKAVAEKQEYLDGWQRARAELINYKREQEQSRGKFAQMATEDLIRQLVPILDGFEMALAHTAGNKEEEWTSGFMGLYKELQSVLSANGVTMETPEKGDPFDPTKHDAVEMVDVSEHKMDGAIISVVQKGIMLHGNEIRAPRVTVGVIKNKK